MSEVPIGVVTMSDRAAAGVYEDKGGPGIEAALAGDPRRPPWRPVRRLVAGRARGNRSGVARSRGRRALLADPGDRRHRPEPARRDAGGDASGLRPAHAGVRRVDARAQPAGGADARFCRARSPGLRGRSLIVNLPGRPAAIGACLGAVFPAVPYCLDLIGGDRLETNP